MDAKLEKRELEVISLSEDEEIEKIKMKILEEKIKELERLKKGVKTFKPDGSVHKLNSVGFDSFLGSADEYLVLVDFWASWCAPCRMMAPILENLAKEYKGRVFFAKLNVDENPEIATRFNVYSIPTFVFFKRMKPVDTVTGAVGYVSLKKAIERNLKKFK